MLEYKDCIGKYILSAHEREIAKMMGFSEKDYLKGKIKYIKDMERYNFRKLKRRFNIVSWCLILILSKLVTLFYTCEIWFGDVCLSCWVGR